MLKKLSNKSEKKVYEQIASEAVKYDASVYRKVRVADVIDIEQLPSRPLGSYALQAHFDFVVSDEEEKPLFAVEYDGPGHDNKSDWNKDDICLKAGLALFRVDLQSSRAETARMSFLRYLVNLWFLATKFAEMQAAGELSPDEPFVISGFLKPDAKHVFDSEFDLLGPARGRLNHFCKKNGIPGGPFWHLQAAEALFTHEAGSFAAFSSLKLDNVNLCGRALIGLKMPSRGQLGEVPFSRHEIGQFCTALAIEDLIEELALFQTGAGHVLRTSEEVLEEVENLRHSGYVMLLATHGADDDFAQAIRGK
jgi:hypothetical protein